MKYGDIVAILFVILALYYVAMIAMDLYKANMSKESEKDKEKETEIDISDEVEGFKTIHVSREYPNGKVDKDTVTETIDKKPSADNEETETPTTGSDKAEVKPESSKKVQISESQLMTVNRIKSLAEERIHQHQKEHQAKEMPTQNDAAEDSQPEPAASPIPQKDPTSRPGYRLPNMLGGMTVEEIVSITKRRSMGDDSAMAGIIHTCDAA